MNDNPIKLEGWRYKFRLNLPLEVKVGMTMNRIRQWQKSWWDKTYVSFSGGKDSTVLLDMVRSEFKDTPALFVDTGLEFPEIRQFVKEFSNVVCVKPKRSFKEVIETVGYPVISKMVSMAINRYRNTSDPRQKELRKWGGINPTSGKKQTTGVIPQKYHYLIDAPFKISEACCDFLKKRPYKKFDRESGLAPYVGMMAEDSNMRRSQYFKRGCNQYTKYPKSNPMSFWTEKDIWEYIKTRDLKYSEIYDMGYDRTGCIFCLFGKNLERRFNLLYETHRKQHDFCMGSLKIGEVLTFLKENGNG
ncbi:MAG: class V aminotransferase [Flammeovirgaceae bacterium]|nr:class V aminotransferase [Flammeovirgaceae bacterium]|tara:strand:- start:1 stop:909 length:909 start_codon:yes stop_codon:yes gene_type:complete